MKPILFPSTATTFTSQGLGVLSDCISCVVREERNGEYELTMEYPVGGIHYDEIEDRAIIYAIPSPYRTPQPFRIYLSESPINGVVTFHAHHISYDLSGIPVEPFTASTCADALDGLVTNSVVTNPFTVDTDKSVTGTYKLSVPTSFRSCLGGEQNSILDVYGTGEYEFDKYSVYLHLHRGSDNGVKIAYGKNLTDFNMERNLESIITGVYPYWSNIDENTLVTLTNKVIPIYDVNNPAYLLDSGGNYLLDSDGKYLLVMNPFPFDNILPLDLSLEFEEQPSEDELKAKAEEYIRNNDLGVPKVSINVSFVDLASTEEYKDLAVLEEVDLCDTVTVEFPLYGISVKAKIVSIETDCLLEKYNEVTIGNYRYTIADTLANLTFNQVTKGEMKVGNQKAADVINNTKGVFEWIDNNADGENEGFTIYESEGVAFLRCTAGGIGISEDGGLTYSNAITKYGVTASKLSIEANGNQLLIADDGDDGDEVFLKMYHPLSQTEVFSARAYPSRNAYQTMQITKLALSDAHSGRSWLEMMSTYYPLQDTTNSYLAMRNINDNSVGIYMRAYNNDDSRDANIEFVDSSNNTLVEVGYTNDVPYINMKDSGGTVRKLVVKTATISGTTIHYLGY
jgi:phage minor structural protein